MWAFSDPKVYTSWAWYAADLTITLAIVLDKDFNFAVGKKPTKNKPLTDDDFLEFIKWPKIIRKAIQRASGQEHVQGYQNAVTKVGMFSED